VCPLAVDPQNLQKTMAGWRAGSNQNGWLGRIDPPLECAWKKNPFKTNILKGVTAGVNLFGVGKVL